MGTVLYDAATAAQGFMATMPSIPLLLLLCVVLQPPLVLLHELGHAFVARAVTQGPVAVVVGGTGRLLDGRVGWLQLRICAFGPTPIGALGYATFDGKSVQTHREAVAIAIAGPTASAVGWFAGALWLAAATPTSLGHAMAWTLALEAAGSTILSLIPMRFVDRRGRAHTNDGLLALRVLRHGLAARGAGSRST